MISIILNHFKVQNLRLARSSLYKSQADGRWWGQYNRRRVIRPDLAPSRVKNRCYFHLLGGFERFRA